MSVGQLMVVTGPSGVGKGTLVRALLARYPQIHLSISATTRAPRQGEVNGKDYYFVSEQDFQALIQQEQLLEWAEYAGNYYGTLRRSVEDHIDKGNTVLLEIEVVGATAIHQTFPDAIRIFILPPSEAELARRLQGRGLDSEKAIARRLAKAREEIALSGEFDYTIVNDDFESALAQLEAIAQNTLPSQSL